MSKRIGRSTDSSTSPLWVRYAPARLRQRIEGRTNLFAIVHNAGWLFADKAMRMMMGVLVGAWVARYLGPNLFGELAYVLAFVALFGAVSQLGVDAIAIRDIARNERDAEAILGTIVRLRTIVGFLCWAGAIAGMSLLRTGDRESLLLTAVVAGTLVFQAADTVDLWFQSQTQSKRTVSAKAVAYLIASALRVVMIFAKAPLVAFAFAALFEGMLSAIALIVAYRRYPTTFEWNWDVSWMGRLLTESWPYLVSGLAIVIYMRIDQIMLREMVNEHELGIYSAALPLSTAWYFIPFAVYMSASPTIARLKQTDNARYKQALARLFSFMWWITLPLSAAIALGSGRLVMLLYGKAYSASAAVLAVHIFANVPVALGVVQSMWIVNQGRNRLLLYNTVIGALSNVFLNLLLIPLYGAIGAALATLVSFSMAAVFANVLFAPGVFKLQVYSLFGREPVVTERE